MILIDARDIINRITEERRRWGDDYDVEQVLGDIEDAPTIDAVEVVRCKDCMKYDSHGHRCKHWNHGVVVMDFCSRAERRADDN